MKDLRLAKKDYTKTSLRGITDIANLVSVDKFEKFLKPLIVKPPGAPTLVPASDRRKPYDQNIEASKDFS